jgi:ABC-type oligopeptide transport system ATPase subunit
VGKKREIRAVDGVSFEVNKGEAFGLVGESGSGKTTTGRSIIGLYELTDGEVYFKEELIRKAHKKGEKKGRVTKKAKFLREIQMIFQDPVTSLNPRMTVREIVAEGLKIGGEKDKRLIENKVSETLRLVGLIPEHASRYPHEFSGGQRQRIGIARALVMQPEMIIADEPVSALDVSVQAQVINLLNDLKKRLGLTVLFIAHDLAVVKYFCDRIAVMRMGKIVEIAPSDELFSAPLHPYTKSLISAIPQPSPILERVRTRTVYEPNEEKETQSELRWVGEKRMVRCTEQELLEYEKELNL